MFAMIGQAAHVAVEPGEVIGGMAQQYHVFAAGLREKASVRVLDWCVIFKHATVWEMLLEEFDAHWQKIVCGDLIYFLQVSTVVRLLESAQDELH